MKNGIAPEIKRFNQKSSETKRAHRIESKQLQSLNINLVKFVMPRASIDESQPHECVVSFNDGHDSIHECPNVKRMLSKVRRVRLSGVRCLC